MDIFLLHCPTVCTPSYHVCQAVLCHTICTSHQPVRQTIRHRHTVCTTHQPVRQPVRHRPNVCTTPHLSVRPSATVTPSVQHTNQSVSLSVTSRLSDRRYDSSACTSVIPHDSPYPRLKPIPSRREWGAVTHDSPYTRLEPHPSSREWGAIPQGQEIP